jgi:hypothetical protein
VRRSVVRNEAGEGRGMGQGVFGNDCCLICIFGGVEEGGFGHVSMRRIGRIGNVVSVAVSTRDVRC